MQKWEYTTLEMREHTTTLAVTMQDGESLRKGTGLLLKESEYPNYFEYIKELGRNGWDLVGYVHKNETHFHATFKRPLED